MGEHLVQKLAYSYDFKSDDMKPLVETRALLEKDDVLSFFGGREASEPLQKSIKDESLSIAEIQDDVSDATGTVTSSVQNPTEKEDGEDRKYALTYYNPETGKSEVLAVKSSVKIKDYTKKVVEESVGMHSSYPLYSFIATPLITREINETVLQDIKDNREYGTPPKFGGAAIAPISVVASPRQIVQNQSTVVSVSTQESQRNAVAEAVQRKEVMERRVGEEIVVLEHAVQELRRNQPADQAISCLPALSRARFQELIKRRKISNATVLALIEKDVSFLKVMRKKLKSLSLTELLDLAKVIKVLKEK